ncbi:MAG: tape measure protein [Oscillospiraceae bacterium]
MAYDGSLVFDSSMDSSGFQKDANKLSDIVKGLGIFKVLSAGVQMVASSVDAAIARVDTLNKFPQMMEKMGFSAEQADTSIDKLSNGIQGLPTKLDDIVSFTQQLASMTGDLEGATNTALALNNALYASGAASEDASRAQLQYTQMLAKGTVDMQSWRTLQETMPYALQKTAEAFGFAGSSAQNDFYKALQSGEITFDQFNAKIIELNAGTGGFAEVAKTATGGFATAWANMQTAVVRGTANIITSIDKGLSQTRFKSIETVIVSLGKNFKGALDVAADGLKLVAENADTVALVVGVAAGATVTYKVATLAVIPAVKAYSIASKEASAAVWLLQSGETAATVSASGLTIGQSVLAATTGVLTGKIGLATAAQLIWNTAMATNPIGAVVVATAALVAVVGILAINLSKESEESAKLTENIKALKTEHDELADSVKSSKASYDESVASLEQQASASEALYNKVKQLASIENKSESDKYRLKLAVDAFNESAGRQLLAYNETTGAVDGLNKSTENYITNLKASAKAEADRKRLVELYEQQAKAMQGVEDAQKSLIEIEDAGEKIYRNIFGRESDHGAYSQKYMDAMDVLESYQQTLEETNQGIDAFTEESIANYEAQGEAMDSTSTQLAELAAKYGVTTDEINASVAASSLSLDEWATAQEEAVKRQEEALETYTDAVTNMHSKIKTSGEISVAQMNANLEHNTKATEQWADNLQTLAARGLDEGLLRELQEAGPESAALVASLVQGTDTEIAKLNENLALAGETGIAAWMSAFNIEAEKNPGTSVVEDTALGINSSTALTDASKKMVADAKTAATTQVSASNFSTVGRQMAEGIAAGIRAGQSSITSAIESVISAALAAGNKKAEVNSPSRLFKRELGLPIMEGWALGLKEGQKDVVSGITDTITAMERVGSALFVPVVAQLQGSVEANQSGLTIGATAPSYSTGSSLGVGSSVHLEQNIYAPQAPTPSEMTQEGIAFIAQTEWLLP